MPNPIALTALVTAAICASTATAAGIPNLIVISQNRYTDCSTLAQIQQNTLIDSDDESAPDSDPWSSNIGANSSLSGANANATATQLSLFSPPNTLTASGDISAIAVSSNNNGHAEAGATSYCEFEFSVNSNSTYSLIGSVTGDHSGAGAARLSQGATTIINHATAGTPPSITIDDTGVLVPGTYTFLASADGFGFAGGFFTDNPSAAYNVALNVVEICPGDANLDGVIDVNDISFVLFRLGDTGTPGEYLEGDANNDAVVDVNDISYILFRLADPCP